MGQMDVKGLLKSIGEDDLLLLVSFICIITLYAALYTTHHVKITIYIIYIFYRFPQYS